MSAEPELPRRRIAVIGAGVAGLGAAWLLARRHEVTLYERNGHLGGHSNTVHVRQGGRDIPVDTGFIVYNEQNYPNLVRLFAALDVPTAPSSMSFSVSIDGGRVEYAGGDVLGLFAQPRNILRPAHWRMLGCALRFFHSAAAMIDRTDHEPTLGEFLRRGRYSRAFVEEHLLPMTAAIWSVPPATIAGFPARSVIRFFENHGLLRYFRRPQWRTVRGGSVEYVSRLVRAIGPELRRRPAAAALRVDAEGVMVRDACGGEERFDHAVVAAHADEALALLADPTPEERRVLGAFRYQPNRTILHGDAALMPKRRRVWSSWNYISAGAGADQAVSVTYWMNRLQPIDPAVPLFVSLNPLREPAPGMVHAEFVYDHPVYDAAAMAAQALLPSIQGRRGIWFCGSYFGHGFHEDALSSGLAAAEALGLRRPWPEAMAQHRLVAEPRVRPIGTPAPALGDD